MDTQIGLYFKKISEKLEKLTNGSPKTRELTFSQGKILWYLHRNDGKDVTLRDIEKFFDISHATVSGLLARLTEKGYVYLETSATDRRAKNVRLTEKERRSVQAMQQRHRKMEDGLLHGFSEEEKKVFSDYLQRVYENLDRGVNASDDADDAARKDDGKAGGCLLPADVCKTVGDEKNGRP